MALALAQKSGDGNTEPSPSPLPKNRKWCFTSFELEPPEFNEKIMLYLCYGKETCPSTKKEHWQGFVIFKNARSLSGCKKSYGSSIHFEPTRGTDEQNIKYCSKDGAFTEHGSRPVGQGKRTDVTTLAELVRAGKTDAEIANTIVAPREGTDGPKRDFGDVFIKFYRGVRELRAIITDKPRMWEMDVRIYWGAPGTGKTRSVYEEFPADEVYPKMVGKWWDGYSGQKVVLIDDFDPENCFDITYDFYLKLLDRYPLRIEWKGGSGNFYSHIIIFTSNTDPAKWFPLKGNRDAFFRRVKTIKRF